MQNFAKGRGEGGQTWSILKAGTSSVREALEDNVKN